MASIFERELTAELKEVTRLLEVATQEHKDEIAAHAKRLADIDRRGTALCGKQEALYEMIALEREINALAPSLRIEHQPEPAPPTKLTHEIKAIRGPDWPGKSPEPPAPPPEPALLPMAVRQPPPGPYKDLTPGRAALAGDVPKPQFHNAANCEIAPGVFVTQQVAGRWTPERIALLRRDWPTVRSAPAIFEAVNQLPGDPIPNLPILNTFMVTKLGIRRQNLPMHPDALAMAPPPVDPDPPCLPPMEDVTTIASVTVEVHPVEEPPRTVVITDAMAPATRAAVVEVAKQIGAEVESDQKLPKPSEGDNVLAFERPQVESLPKPQEALAKQASSASNDSLLIADAARTLGYIPTDPFKGPKPAFTITAPAPPPPTRRPTVPPQPVARPNLGPNRLAQALKLPDRFETVREPIEADEATIRMTSELWGITFRGIQDLTTVNNEASRRNARPFRLVVLAPAQKKRRCLTCQAPFTLKQGEAFHMCEHHRRQSG